MAEYNHSVFNLAAEEPFFEAFKNRLHVGERAPSFALEDLRTQETVQMKSLWAQAPAIIEFGSFT